MGRETLPRASSLLSEWPGSLRVHAEREKPGRGRVPKIVEADFRQLRGLQDRTDGMPQHVLSSKRASVRVAKDVRRYRVAAWL